MTEEIPAWPKLCVSVVSDHVDFVAFLGKTRWHDGRVLTRQGILKRPKADDPKTVEAYFAKRFQEAFFHWGIK